MYTVSGSVIVERFPYAWSFCGTLPMEAAPFYHVDPGSQCLVIGTASCNFRCRYCSNAYVAKENPDDQQALVYRLSPGELVGVARKLRCRSIVFNANEPTVSLPSLLEVAKHAEAASIPMGCLTNGYTTVESTEALASIFSFFNISMKGLSAGFNKTYIGIDSCAPVLRNIKRLARDRHVEITTPILQGVNEDELDEIADFIAEVDTDIPWHVFRLLPEDEMKHAEYPNIQAIDSSLQSIRKRLPYVYFHNFVGSDWVNTLCPSCGYTVIERFSLGCGGDKLKQASIEDEGCPKCGTKIKLLRTSACSGNGRRIVYECSNS